MYDKLPVKVNAIDTKITNTSLLEAKTQYDSDTHGLEKRIEDVNKKIPNTSGLVKKNESNTKIPENENKIPSLTGLGTTAAFNAKVTEIENKISDTSGLIRKTLLLKQKLKKFSIKYVIMINL